MDTGIDLKHPDLVQNIDGAGASFILGTTANDDNGHGTHVAGTIAAVDNELGVVGVASGAKLIPVKVLNRKGTGAFSGIIAGIEWVTANAQIYDIKVANMSLGGFGKSDGNCGFDNNDPLHQAICKSRDVGITYVVAAGNSSADAATQVPAAYNDAVITVSALADYDGSAITNDLFATFSNYNGTIVDLGAPGVNIYSTYKNGGYATLSGTSMAAPHVSGAAALFLTKNPQSTFDKETFNIVREGLKLIGEKDGEGHTATLLHPEAVVNVSSLQID